MRVPGVASLRLMQVDLDCEEFPCLALLAYAPDLAQSSVEADPVVAALRDHAADRGLALDVHSHLFGGDRTWLVLGLFPPGAADDALRTRMRQRAEDMVSDLAPAE
jgi:hypothetical protein